MTGKDRSAGVGTTGPPGGRTSTRRRVLYRVGRRLDHGEALIDPTDGDTDKDSDARRIHDDVEVDGVLRIADDTVCEGDLIAPGGVILGERVRVEGDVYTDGAVEMAPGARIEGDVIPLTNGHALDATAEIGPTEEAQRVDQAASDRPDEQATPGRSRLEASALASTLDVLLTLALDHGEEDRPMGLRADALDDLLEGAYHLMVDLYRDGDAARPWPMRDVTAILIQQVLPLVLPVRLEGRDERALQLHVGRPQVGTHRDEVPPRWPEAVVAFLEHVTGTLDGSAEADLISPEGKARGPQGPSSIAVLLRFNPA